MFSIIKEIIKWGSFLFVLYIFWLILTIVNPDMRFVLLPFVIIFLIFNFPRALFKLISDKYKKFKESQKSSEENIGDIEDIEEIEEVYEEYSAIEEVIFKSFIVISIVFSVLIIYIFYENLEIERQISLSNFEDAGISLSQDPIQIKNKEKHEFVIKSNNIDFKIKPLARYKIAGIVVVKNSLLYFDAAKDISPIDIGLVWGDLARPEVYKRMSFYSNFRLMTYSFQSGFSYNRDYILTHSSHNHIIYADNKVKRQIENLKKHNKVILEGYLVEVTSTKLSGPWTSSLRRDDHLLNSGRGCEIFYVEKVVSM
ncbi:MAG: hypothetical protein AB1782_17515 [Cyanobacteriota bacterium]